MAIAPCPMIVVPARRSQTRILQRSVLPASSVACPRSSRTPSDIFLCIVLAALAFLRHSSLLGGQGRHCYLELPVELTTIAHKSLYLASVQLTVPTVRLLDSGSLSSRALKLSGEIFERANTASAITRIALAGLVVGLGQVAG